MQIEVMNQSFNRLVFDEQGQKLCYDSYRNWKWIGKDIGFKSLVFLLSQWFCWKFRNIYIYIYIYIYVSFSHIHFVKVEMKLTPPSKCLIIPTLKYHLVLYPMIVDYLHRWQDYLYLYLYSEREKKIYFWCYFETLDHPTWARVTAV